MEGFTGDLCEEDINDCAADPCIHGTCIDGVAGFTCINCEPGYQGRLCEIGTISLALVLQCYFLLIAGRCKLELLSRIKFESDLRNV